MKKLFLLLCIATLAITHTVRATIVMSDDFSYSNGNLFNQGGWAISSGSGSTPIQVSGGEVVNMTAGSGSREDLNKNLGTTMSGTVYTLMDLTMTSGTNPTGQAYFYHLQSATTGSVFVSRIFMVAPSTGTGFRLGIGTNSNSDSGTIGLTALTSNLSFNITYSVAMKYDRAGQTVSLWVGTDESLFDELLPTITLSSIGATAVGVDRVNLRQGGTTPTYTGLKLDNLIVADSFSNIVPEPSSVALTLMFGMGLLAMKRRSRGNT